MIKNRRSTVADPRVLERQRVPTQELVRSARGLVREHMDVVGASRVGKAATSGAWCEYG
jgi:hypothetical protein